MAPTNTPPPIPTPPAICTAPVLVELAPVEVVTCNPGTTIFVTLSELNGTLPT